MSQAKQQSSEVFVNLDGNHLKGSSNNNSFFQLHLHSNSMSSLPNGVNNDSTITRSYIATMVKNAIGSNEEKSKGGDDHFEGVATTKSTKFSKQAESSYYKFRKSQSNSLTLTFKDIHFEDQFMKFFIKKNQPSLKIFALVCLAVFTAIYIMGFVMFPQQAQNWLSTNKNLVQPSTQIMSNSGLCTPGYYCSTCPLSKFCGNYNLWTDVLFYLVIAIPCLLIYYVGTLSDNLKLRIWYSASLAIFLLVIPIVGVMVRYRIVEPFRNPLMPGIFLLISLQSYNGVTLRYIYTVLNLTATWLAWIIVISTETPTYRTTYIYELVIVGLAITLKVLVLCFNAYRSEIYYRDVFLRMHFSMKVNTKLASQLRALQKTYTDGVVDLESPLEKSIAIIKSILADPSIASDQLQSLEIVVTLLNSPQLLQPDLEGQFGESSLRERKASIAIDNDQREWLLSEISKRRPDVKRRQSSVGRKKRKSIYGVTESTPYGAPEVPVVPSEYNPGTLVRDQSGYQSSNASQKDTPDAHLDLSTLNQRDPFTYSSERFNLENPPGLPEKRALDLITESYAGSLVQIIRPKGVHQTHNYSPETLHALLDNVEEWNWNIFEFSEACPGGKPLYIFAWHMFDCNNLFEEFKLPLDKFNNFFWKIQDGYRDLPYHNSIHATDVMHAVNYMNQFEKVATIFSPLDLMSLYFAAAVHDFDHPGVNNNFLITTSNPLAVLYNDKAVLESYHVSSAFQVLLKQENNFLAHLPKEDWQAFRELVIDMVLATDLSQHYATLSAFKTRLQNSFNPEENKEDRILLSKMIIKIADVSNPTKEYQIYSKWTSLVLDEWRNQGDQEKLLTIPVSPFMDRDNPNVLLSSQSGFIEFIIVPMFDTFHNGFMKIPVPMDELEKNKQYWMRIKEAKDLDNANGGNATTITIIRKTAPSSSLLPKINSESELNTGQNSSASNTIRILKNAAQHLAQEGTSLVSPTGMNQSRRGSTQKDIKGNRI